MGNLVPPFYSQKGRLEKGRLGKRPAGIENNREDFLTVDQFNSRKRKKAG